jgi:putative ABC transport system permease protein
MHTAFQDIRYALRQLRKTPGFACTAILILALGIGGTTAIFSALNPILIEPLPYAQANRIMMIWYPGASGQREPQTFHTFREVAQRNRTFESLAVMKAWQPTLLTSDEPERLDGQQVSADYFRALGVSAALGRTFQPPDDVFKGPKVIVLSDGLWKRRFGADRLIVGQQVRLDDTSYTVIGVMPPAFENVLSPSSQVWSPLQYNPENVASHETREWGHHLRMIGRLRAEARFDRARQDLQWIAETPVSEFPRPLWASLERGLILNSLQNDVTRSAKPGLIAIFFAVVLVLLIACVNVTNLVLARSSQRQGEFAMRAALGAAPPRLICQLITESLMLAVLGGGLGLVITQLGIKILVSLSPAGLPRVSAIRFDITAFAFAFAVTLLVGVAIGLIPARHASRVDLQNGLRPHSQRTVGSHQVTRRTFVVAEVALALVLLVSTGLLLHSLTRLFAVPTGFDSSHLLTMQVQTYGIRYDDNRLCHQFFAQALDRVGQIPGVTAAAFTSQLPLSGDSDIYGAQFVGDAPELNYPVYRYAVTPGYFGVMGIPLLRGRLFDDHDVAETPHVMLISESFATRKFPNQDPIGQRVHVGGLTTSPLFTIVGVVGDVKQISLALNDTDAVYTTTTQWHWADGTLSLIVRSNGNVASLTTAIQNAIWSVDREQAVVRVAMMDDLVATSATERRFVLILFEAFGLIALVLAATGIYAVLSGNVTERTREIGVRSALGASRSSIVRLVVRQAMALTAIGLASGLAGAAVASQAIATMLFGVSPLDPATYVVVIIVLTAVSAAACSIPAWRAARIDPMVALRYE